MITTPHPQRTDTGFSLIELSIIITAFAILLTSLLGTGDFARESKDIERMQTQMETIEDAIQNFVDANGYLPCPANRTSAVGSANFGMAITGNDCNETSQTTGTIYIDNGGTDDYQLRIGMIPVRDLGLPDHYAMDIWGNRLTYGIIRVLGISQPVFDAYAPTQASDYFNVVDETVDPAVTYGTSSSEIVAYVLLSHGEDGKGAFTEQGSAGLSCGSNSEDDIENCDNDKTFLDHFSETTSFGAGYFNDWMRWKRLSDL